MEIKQSKHYAKWFDGLGDRMAKMRIDRRVKKAARGEYGDVKSIGSGVSEMRFHFGPGYRVYFTERAGAIFLLLAGGTKKTQAEDIELAQKIAASI